MNDLLQLLLSPAWNQAIDHVNDLQVMRLHARSMIPDPGDVSLPHRDSGSAWAVRDGPPRLPLPHVFEMPSTRDSDLYFDHVHVALKANGALG